MLGPKSQCKQFQRSRVAFVDWNDGVTIANATDLSHAEKNLGGTNVARELVGNVIATALALRCLQRACTSSLSAQRQAASPGALGTARLPATPS